MQRIHIDPLSQIFFVYTFDQLHLERSLLLLLLVSLNHLVLVDSEETFLWLHNHDLCLLCGGEVGNNLRLRCDSGFLQLSQHAL